jgi:tRNA (guanine-N7-)-methyltransferase
VSKGKLEKFAEVEGFSNVIQPPFNEVFQQEHSLKGRWNGDYFKNQNTVTLELGCGKGEYTVGLAKLFPERNFIGIDIKGSRIWKGAKTAIQDGLTNVAFIRTQIDFIESFFKAGEVQEIWITFPDPQLKKFRKRLTSSLFLKRYQKFLQKDGFINLKTDSAELFEYTRELALHNKMKIGFLTDDLYRSGYDDKILSIRTYYESMWLAQGKPIHFIRFQLNNSAPEEPGDDE